MTVQGNVTGRKSPTRAVCNRYGVSDRTVARWWRNPKLGFPQPVTINGRLYFAYDELDAFDRARAARKAEVA
jgi:hypothetical protein